MSHISPIIQRLRITFGKSGPLKYTGNLDIAKTWERVLRRANIPLLYTQGFNTRPRLQLASPLPLGITSECELLDVALRETISLDNLIDDLLAVSPTGLDIYAVEDVAVDSPALQQYIESAEYRICFEDGIDPDVLQQHIDALLQQDRIIKIVEKKRRGKIRRSSIDLRPLIHSLSINTNSDLIAHLSVGDNGNMRPDELLEQLGLADEYTNIHRFTLHIRPTS